MTFNRSDHFFCFVDNIVVDFKTYEKHKEGPLKGQFRLQCLKVWRTARAWNVTCVCWINCASRELQCADFHVFHAFCSHRSCTCLHTDLRWALFSVYATQVHQSTFLDKLLFPLLSVGQVLTLSFQTQLLPCTTSHRNRRKCPCFSAWLHLFNDDKKCEGLNQFHNCKSIAPLLSYTSAMPPHTQNHTFSPPPRRAHQFTHMTTHTHTRTSQNQLCQALRLSTWWWMLLLIYIKVVGREYWLQVARALSHCSLLWTCCSKMTHLLLPWQARLS